MNFSLFCIQLHLTYLNILISANSSFDMLFIDYQASWPTKHHWTYAIS